MCLWFVHDWQCLLEKALNKEPTAFNAHAAEATVWFMETGISCIRTAHHGHDTLTFSGTLHEKV